MPSENMKLPIALKESERLTTIVMGLEEMDSLLSTAQKKRLQKILRGFGQAFMENSLIKHWLINGRAGIGLRNGSQM